MRRMIALLLVVAALGLLALGGCRRSQSSVPDQLSNGKETVAQYAARNGIKDTELTLDLGNKVTMKLVLIPSGKFTMGGSQDDRNRCKNETPQHEVTITKPFYMGVYVVTQEQYQQVMGKNVSKFKGLQNPVDVVCWVDAVDFCKKLSEKTGTTVRLPTEAEWEYACRAGTTTRFYFGDAETAFSDYAWFWPNSESKTHPVGQKKPNAWGLYDMHGNVWQWCSDWFGKDYYSANANDRDPQGPATGTDRVLRGGSWIEQPESCRSSTRGSMNPTPWCEYGGDGFRVVVDVK